MRVLCSRSPKETCCMQPTITSIRTWWLVIRMYIFEWASFISKLMLRFVTKNYVIFWWNASFVGMIRYALILCHGRNTPMRSRGKIGCRAAIYRLQTCGNFVLGRGRGTLVCTLYKRLRATRNRITRYHNPKRQRLSVTWVSVTHTCTFTS